MCWGGESGDADGDGRWRLGGWFGGAAEVEMGRGMEDVGEEDADTTQCSHVCFWQLLEREMV